MKKTLLLLCLFVSFSFAVELQQMTNSTALEKTKESPEFPITTSTILNTIPNAMIWINLDYSNVTLHDDEVVVGTVDLYYSNVPGNMTSVLFVMLAAFDNDPTSHSFAWSTCSSQIPLGKNSSIDLGNKVGNWTLRYQDYSEVGYTITATVGAQAGLLEANTNYTVTSIPVPVVYFDFDLSTIGDNVNYQVTFTLYTTSSDGFSWLRGLVARSNDCPSFDWSYNLEASPNQVYLQGNSNGKQISMVFPSLPAQPSHLAVQMTTAALKSDLTITWSAVGLENSGSIQSQSGGGGGGDSGLSTIAIILGSSTIALIVLAFVLTILAIFMIYKIVSLNKRTVYQSV